MKSVFFLRRSALALALSCASVFSAQAADPSFLLDLGGQRFDLLTHPPRGARAMGQGPDLRIVQFNGPIRAEWLEALRADGVEPLQYIHPYSYVVWSDTAALARAAARAQVRASGDFVPEFRLAESSRGLDTKDYPASVMLSRHADAGARNTALQAAGAVLEGITRLDGHFDIAQVRLPGNRYQDLAAVPGVYAVQRIVPITEEDAFRGEMSQQSVVGAYGGAPGYTIVPGYESWLAGTGYDGTGVVVGIVDGGIRSTHQDLSTQMAPCVSAGGSQTSCASGNSAHGTHVASAVAGTGASGVLRNGFLSGQGVAPGANVISQRYGPFLPGSVGGMVANGMLTIFRESALSGAVVTNNSWGPTETPQGYDVPTRQVDMIARDALADEPGQQPLIPVWSIMNGGGDGTDACAPSSVASPDEAKNLFAVGSTALQGSGGAQQSGIFNVSSNSAHGNACDGRRIPHIVAPGCYTESASNTSNSAFTMMCGTSMASPVVSGAVALFIEKYRDTHDDATPSPALVKAAFTAAAMNLQGFRDADNRVMGHRPDRFQGYGRLDLEAVLNPAETVLYFEQDEVFTTSGQQWVRTIAAADPARPMRLMLAWSDAPGHGLGGTTPAWVNNLDLSVGTGSDLYHGNVIGSDGWSATGGSADEKNNLEGVFLGPAQHGGAITVTVTAANIAADALNPHAPGAPAQDFALACYNCAMEPDFGIAVAPSRVAVCAPDEAQAAVSVLSIGGYADPVTLDVLDAPAGANASFDVSVVTPAPAPTPGASTLTIGNTAAIAPGSHTLLVTGTAGAVTRSAAFDLLVSSAVPAAPVLAAPGNGASGVSLAPTLSWNATPGAVEYLVELAADAGFAAPLFSAITPDTSVVVSSALDTGTVYHWRVTAQNACGVVAAGSASFRTVDAPGDCGPDTEPFVLFSEDFTEGVGGFSTAGGTGASTWALSTSQTSPMSGGNAMRANAIGTVSDQRLTSPVIALPGGETPIVLAFQNWRNIENNGASSCWDGGLLEISTDGENFAQITGTALLNDPYRGTISGTVNPLAGMQAWCEPADRPYADTRVDLSAWAGQDVQLRWRLGTDNLYGREGWYVDDIRVRSCRGAEAPEIFEDGFEGG